MLHVPRFKKRIIRKYLIDICVSQLTKYWRQSTAIIVNKYILHNSLHVSTYSLKNWLTKVIDSLLLIEQKTTVLYYQLNKSWSRVFTYTSAVLKHILLTKFVRLTFYNLKIFKMKNSLLVLLVYILMYRVKIMCV